MHFPFLFILISYPFARVYLHDAISTAASGVASYKNTMRAYIYTTPYRLPQAERRFAEIKCKGHIARVYLRESISTAASGMAFWENLNAIALLRTCISAAPYRLPQAGRALGQSIAHGDHFARMFAQHRIDCRNWQGLWDTPTNVGFSSSGALCFVGFRSFSGPPF